MEAPVEPRRKRALKGEVISVGVLAVIVVGGWFGLITVLGTSTPFFVVSSGSMIPTLRVGDIIVIRGGGSVDNLQVGDIIVFKQPQNGERVIVHRVFRMDQIGGETGIITKGDNNPSQDGWIVRQQNFLGKVLLHVPYIGYAAIWLSPPLNYALMIVIISVIVAIEFRPKKDDKESQPTAVPPESGKP